MKFLKKIIAISLLLILFFLSRSIVHAEVIELPYLVNGQIHPTQSMMKNLARMFFVQTISFEYESGKVLLSFNEHGSGNIYIGDTLYVNNLSTGQSYTYKASDERCVTNEFNSLISPIDITQILRPGMNNIQIRFDDRCGMLKPMGQIYVVNIDQKKPEPFLSLPWDFERKGLSFTEAALSMTSFFDHEYPLLSSNVKEPTETASTIIKFGNSQQVHDSYSSHDGYDYAHKGQVLLGEPVLAAAAGWATYVKSCSACGNMILIDHEQGYQTQYLHLQKDGLITTSPATKIWVNDRQPIGKVGATGNVYPSGDIGAHIHFGVVEDKNKDGNFTDNIPDGFTDPFGWYVKDGSPDPWTIYSFIQNGQTKHGDKSYYLWKTPLASMRSTIPPEGGNVSAGSFTIKFGNSVDESLMIDMKPSFSPLLELPVEILGYAIQITARNFVDTLVTEFRDFFELQMKIIPDSLSPYNLDTLALYSSSDGIHWIKQPTTINLSNNILTAKANHLSYFAFTAEKKDSPEVELYYDPITLDLMINSRNLSETTTLNKTKLSKNGKLQQIDLNSNNSTHLAFIMKNDNRIDFNQMYVDSFQYSNASFQKLPTNYFATKIINQSSPYYKKLLQVFEIKNELKVKLEYSYQKNKTVAVVEKSGEEPHKEVFTGVRILKLYSDKGNLNYMF